MPLQNFSSIIYNKTEIIECNKYNSICITEIIKCTEINLHKHFRWLGKVRKKCMAMFKIIKLN